MEDEEDFAADTELYESAEEEEEEQEENLMMVASFGQLQHVGRVIASDYEQKINLLGAELGVNVSYIIKHITNRSDIRIKHKNPLGIILGYVMLSFVDNEGLGEKEAFEKTQKKISAKHKITPPDVLRYYFFLKQLKLDLSLR